MADPGSMYASALEMYFAALEVARSQLECLALQDQTSAADGEEAASESGDASASAPVAGENASESVEDHASASVIAEGASAEDQGKPAVTQGVEGELKRKTKNKKKKKSKKDKSTINQDVPGAETSSSTKQQGPAIHAAATRKDGESSALTKPVEIPSVKNLPTSTAKLEQLVERSIKALSGDKPHRMEKLGELFGSDIPCPFCDKPFFSGEGHEECLNFGMPPEPEADTDKDKGKGKAKDEGPPPIKQCPNVSDRTHGTFGVPFRANKPISSLDANWDRPGLHTRDAMLKESEDAIHELLRRIEEWGAEPTGPSPQAQKAFNNWRASHPDAPKKRKGQSWGERWTAEVLKDLKELQDVRKGFESTKEADEKTVCDCGHYPYCSVVCDGRLHERAYCTCKKWPLCEVACPNWQRKYKADSVIWDKYTEDHQRRRAEQAKDES